MARKKTTGISDLLFDEVNPYGAVIGDVVSRPVERFPLEAIRPDPGQPRRLLPGDLAEALSRGEMAPAAALREWLRRTASDPDAAAARRDVRELQRLAAAIEQHGLINPITIRPAETGPGRYWVVTGERRYWAHVLLAAEGRPVHEGAALESPEQIKAAPAPPGASIRAHQIIENLMREDINVIEKAHGLVALRQEMSEAGAPADDAYRRHSPQGGPARVPWKAVEDALDISRQYRLRIVSVLELSAEAQALVDRHDLAEATIRPVVEKLKPWPELQMRALRQIVAWQEAEARGEGQGRPLVPSARALVERLLMGKQAPPEGGAAAAGLDFDRFRRQVRGTLRYMEKLDPQARADLARAADSPGGAGVVEALRALRAQIDAVLGELGITNYELGEGE